MTANIFDDQDWAGRHTMSSINFQHSVLKKKPNTLVIPKLSVDKTGGSSEIRNGTYYSTPVVVKTIIDEVWDTRSQNEARILQNLIYLNDCPETVVCMYGVYRTSDTNNPSKKHLNFIFEKMDGDLEGDYANFINKNKSFNVVDKLYYALYATLHVFHDINSLHLIDIFHMDIKPANFMYKFKDEVLRIKVIDLGSACHFKDHRYGTAEQAVYKGVMGPNKVDECITTWQATPVYNYIIYDNYSMHPTPKNRHELIASEIYSAAVTCAGVASLIMKATPTERYPLAKRYQQRGSEHRVHTDYLPVVCTQHIEYKNLGEATLDAINGALHMINQCLADNANERPSFDVVILAVALALNLLPKPKI